MTGEFLGDRKSGLENAFFAQQDAILRQRLGKMDESKSRKQALSTASGITDDAVLEKLLAQDISSVTLAALALVPLVLVAWADGEIDAKERSAVLNSAQQSGLNKQDPSYLLLEGWLERKPPADLVKIWKDYASALSATLADDARIALSSELLDRARTVAKAAGGFMGMGQKVSPSEQAVLDNLEQAFRK